MRYLVKTGTVIKNIKTGAVYTITIADATDVVLQGKDGKKFKISYFGLNLLYFIINKGI